ncbi:hypothetical protein Tco_0149917 [Tanacetum coccineum]
MQPNINIRSKFNNLKEQLSLRKGNLPKLSFVLQYMRLGHRHVTSIPCFPECKIVGKIFFDHPLRYALTTTADVPVVYLQQFWRTVSKIPDTQDIKFMLDTQEVGYQGVVDIVSAFYTKFLAQPWQTMFNLFNRCLTTRTSGHDHTKINILQLFHVVVNKTNVDYAALLWWDFINNVFQKKEAIQYPRFIKLIITDLMKKFPSIPPRIEEDYHSIKDDILLVSVYTIGNVTVRGMLIPDEFLTEEIRATDDFKEYETAFMNVEEIEKMVEGEENEESYASEFADSMLNEDVDDSEIEKEKKDDEIEKEKKVDDFEKTDEVVKEKDNDEVATGSMEFRNEKIQTPIPTPTRSPRKDLSFDKTISEELTATVSPTTATISKYSSIPKRKKRSISYKMKILPRSIAGMCRRRGQIRLHIKNKFINHEFFMAKIREVLDHCNKVVPETTFAKTNEMIKEEMPRLVNLVVNKDREVDPINVPEFISKEFATHGPKMIEELFRKHMQNTTLNLYPTTSSSTTEKSIADLQQQLYLNMKTKPQDQATDPELWEILKAKFEKP